MHRRQPTYRQVSALTTCLLLFFIPFSPAMADRTKEKLSQQLLDALELRAPGRGAAAFLLPDSDDFAAIPQDPNNPITAAKVRLGQLLFHETAFGTETPAPDRSETYSCATCHHAAAGFKSGATQGVGDGGSGFARDGKRRRLASGIDADAPEGHVNKPDFQPVTSPTALNAAYQDVMLWDGSLGNTNGGINSIAAKLYEVGPPDLHVNAFGLSGLETQVLAGTRVHRLRFDKGSILQTNNQYRRLYNKAYPDDHTGYIPAESSATPEALGAAKAIAAYERTLLANRAPFQQWLRGKEWAMSKRQLKGALLFFGKANCVSCHTGPALSSAVGASDDQIFFNVGFKNLNTNKKHIHGTVSEGVSRGRGNFTGNPNDDYKFKVTPLYNLKDTRVFGHGASFRTIRQLLRYKNRGKPQRRDTRNLAAGFRPLNLSYRELGQLETFLKSALYDAYLHRYQPRNIPSGNCFPAADFKSALDLRCW